MYIHTFEVSSTLTNKEFYDIEHDLKLKDMSKWKAKDNGMQYWGLSHKGITINLHIIKKPGFYSYKILYRISARRVIDNDNFIGLFNTSDYPELEEKVNELLKEKCPLLPKLNKCTLKRIDFCINAELDNQEQVKAYIKTMKKGNVPSGLEIPTEYNKTSKRRKPGKNEFKVASKDYIEISIYNKYKEMKSQKSGVYPESEIERAKNIVRIEIRCMKGKLKTLNEKYKIKSISSFMRKAYIIGEELYEYYLGKMLGKGMIYTLSEALQRVDMSEYKKKQIKLLKAFITDCNQSRSVVETYTDYQKTYGKDKTKRILEKLEDIATNYVTVANSDAKLFDNNRIPSPYELYKYNDEWQ